MKRNIFFVIMLAVVMVFGMLSCSSSSALDTAPNFSLKDLNGNTFNFSSTKGKVVILDFWATWCPPCRMEVPDFEALYKKYSKSGLVVVGVSLDRGGAGVVKSFAAQNGLTYPIVIGNREVTSSYGGINGIPTTFIIDRKGRVVNKFVGYRSKKVFRSEIEKLL